MITPAQQVYSYPVRKSIKGLSILKEDRGLLSIRSLNLKSLCLVHFKFTTSILLVIRQQEALSLRLNKQTKELPIKRKSITKCVYCV